MAAALRAGGVALAGAAAWIGVLGLGAALSEPLPVGPAGAALAACLAVVTAAPWLVPAALLVGWFVAVEALVRSGGLRGLAVVGRSRGALIAPAIVVGALAGGLAGVLGSAATPHTLHVAREAAHHAPLTLRAGHPVAVGPGAFIVDRIEGGVGVDAGGRLGDVVFTADKLALLPTRSGPAVALEGAVLHAPGARVRVGRATLPIAPGRRRVELVERTTPALIQVPRATQARGGDASYAWAVLFKRFTEPVASALAPLALTPLALGRARWPALVGALVGSLVLTRLADGAVGALGPLPAASASLGFIALLGAVGWLGSR